MKLLYQNKAKTYFAKACNGGDALGCSNYKKLDRVFK